MAFNKDKLLKSAEKQVSKGRIEAAIKDYTKILAKGGEDPNILNRIGDLYKRLRKNPDAIRYWEKTAECYEKSGFYVKAIAVQKKIQRLEPSSLQVHRRLAELYHRQGLINDARSHYQHLVDHYLRQQEAASAIGIYQKLIELEPDDPGHRARLAELYRQQQLPAKAVAEYGQIAQLFISHGEFDQARVIYSRALELDSSDPEFVRRGVVALRDAGRVDLAQEFIDSALPLNAEVASFQSLIGGLTGTPPSGTPPMDAPKTEVAPPAAPVQAEPPPELASADAAQVVAPPGVETEDSGVPGAATGGFDLIDTDEGDTAAPAVADSGSSDFSTVPPPADPSFETAAPEVPPPALDEAAPQPVEQVGSPEKGEFEDFELEFDDEAPASMVQPPPDMQDSDAGFAFTRDETGEFEEIELDLDSELGGEPVPAPATAEGRSEDGYEIEGVVFPEAPPGEPPIRAPTEGPPAAVEEIALEVEGFDLPSLDAPEFIPPAETTEAGEAVEATPSAVPAPPSLGDAPPPFSIGDDWEMEADSEVAIEPPAEVPAPPPSPVEEVIPPVDSDAPLSSQGEAPVMVPPEPSPAPTLVPETPPSLVPEPPPGLQIEASAAPMLPPVDSQPASPSPPPSVPPPGVGLPPVEVPETVQRVNDLLAEAEVFVKYGLQEKAVDRLEEVLRLDSKHLGAATQLVRLQLDRQEHEKVAPLVNQLYLDVEETGAMELWGEIKQQLLDTGYSFEGETIISLPGEASGEQVEVVSPAAPASPAAADDGGLVDLQAIGAEIDRELGEATRPDDGIDGPATPVSEEATSWLDSASGGESAEKELFEEEEQLFDLGAELQSELEESAAQVPVAPEEQSLEQIIEGFKKGVSENLSPEDSDTHYNLGIAYREMMLLDEAIGEFQISAKDPSYLVDSCAMLGLCFRDKGLPDLALKWYRKGLETTEIDEARALGMLYDVADIYVETEDRTSAYNTFVEIYGINTAYRDVASRMEELAPN